MGDEMVDRASFRQLTISVEKLRSLTAHNSYATTRARLLLGCYRSGDANDPETYVAAVAAKLSRYPEAVITEVTHPVDGLPARCQWLPTIKEIHDACEAAIRGAREQADRDRRLAAQIEARAEPPREVRPTYDDLKARHGEDWGIGDRKPPPPPKSEDQLRAEWGDVIEQLKADPLHLSRLANLQPNMRGE